MRADIEREQVYAAERSAFDGTTIEAVTTLNALRSLADRITSGAGWPFDIVSIVATRRDASTSRTVWAGDGRVEIRIAPPQRSMGTIVHELAHVLAGPDAGHGPIFRAAHLDIAAAALGSAAAAWLADAYRDHGLAVGARRWAPQTAAIAL